MSHLVKANDGYHVIHDGALVPLVRALPNKFFIATTLPTGFASYAVEIPLYVMDGMQFYDFPDGKKQKVGWNPYSADVAFVENPDKPGRWFSQYSPEQTAQRLATRKWIATQFVVDAARLEKIDTITADLYVTQISDAISNDELNIFFTEKLLYDC